MRFVKGLANSILTYVPNIIHICPNIFLCLSPLYSIFDFFPSLLCIFLSFLSLSPLQFVFDFFFSPSFLFLSQLFLVVLNPWLLGLKWWVVSVVARFGLVVVGFDGGRLGVGWVLRWRSGLSYGGD